MLFAGESDKKPAEPITFSATDWPWWRGPQRNGIAAAEQKPPLTWSDSENVLWKSPVVGRGHGSPTVVGDQVFLTAADHDREIQSVLCFHRGTGERLWQADIHQGGFGEVLKKGNSKSSLASSTVACDGTRVYVNFLHAGAIYTTALSRDGKQLWQTKITDYVLHQGFASSPAVYQSLVIVSADNKGTGAIAGLDRATGTIMWKIERPKLPNYTSPIILNVAGREQLLFSGCDLVTSLEPLTGKKLWEIKGSTEECVTSTVTDGKHIFTSGGYPKNHLSAIMADGSGKVAWENGSRVYVPSMLVRDGFLYSVLDAGVAMCWKCDTGEKVWEGRLGGTFSASPVLVDEHLFATNEAGQSFIFKATPAAFELLAENQLGDEVFATPTICGSRIYMRVAKLAEGKRQEWLFCLGKRQVDFADHEVPAAMPRLPRDNLLVFRGSNNEPLPVKTTDDWLKRRAEIVRGAQAVMGVLPGREKRCPLDMKVEEEVDRGSYVRRFITYASEPGSRVPAYLCIPKAALSDKGKPAPAVLCLHGTDNVVGHGVVVGLGDRPNRQYASELAERGYVTLAPNYPLLAKYQPDIKALGWQSGTLKAVWDNMRGLDLLESMPFVKPGVFGTIGHSLGGHNAVYTSVFDERIHAVVSSCGLDSYLDYYNGDEKNWFPEKGWCQTRYMLRLADYRGRLPEIPFDFHELIGALAPRQLLIIAPLKDHNFQAASVDRIATAASEVYKLYGQPTKLRVVHPDCDHDFPVEMRETAYKLFDAVLK